MISPFGLGDILQPPSSSSSSSVAAPLYRTSPPPPPLVRRGRTWAWKKGRGATLLYFHAAFPEKKGGELEFRISEFLSFAALPFPIFYDFPFFFPFCAPFAFCLANERERVGGEITMSRISILFFRFIRICGKLRNFAFFPLSGNIGNGILPLLFRICYVWPKYIFEGTKLFMGCDIWKNKHCPTFTLKYILKPVFVSLFFSTLAPSLCRRRTRAGGPHTSGSNCWPWRWEQKESIQGPPG